MCLGQVDSVLNNTRLLWAATKHPGISKRESGREREKRTAGRQDDTRRTARFIHTVHDYFGNRLLSDSSVDHRSDSIASWFVRLVRRFGAVFPASADIRPRTLRANTHA